MENEPDVALARRASPGLDLGSHSDADHVSVLRLARPTAIASSVSPKLLDLFEAKALDVLLVKRLDAVDPGFLLRGVELRIGVRLRFHGRYLGRF
jgi:hypothetical protein